MEVTGFTALAIVCSRAPRRAPPRPLPVKNGEGRDAARLQLTFRLAIPILGDNVRHRADRVQHDVFFIPR